MSIRPATVRAFQLATLAVMVLAPVLTPAAKTPPPPTNLNGAWTGTYKAGSEKGTVSFQFVQSADTGSFTGVATPNMGGGTVDVSGNYTMSGRKIADGDALVDDGSGAEPATLSGKASKTGSELKMTFTDPSGHKAKVTLTRSI